MNLFDTYFFKKLEIKWITLCANVYTRSWFVVNNLIMSIQWIIRHRISVSIRTTTFQLFVEELWRKMQNYFNEKKVVNWFSLIYACSWVSSRITQWRWERLILQGRYRSTAFSSTGRTNVWSSGGLRFICSFMLGKLKFKFSEIK